MDLTLVLVTLLSLALAAIMTGFAWRLAREERRRSAARVAMLAAEIHGPTASVDPKPAVAAATRRAVDNDLPLRQPVATPRQPVATPAQPAATTSTDLFGAAAEPAPSRAAAAAIGLAALVTFAAFAWYFTTHSSVAAGAARSRPASSAHADSAAAVAPLELTALTHDRDADRLTVRGIVRNPRNGAGVRGLTAVVLVFNRDGAFETSGRATIDTLAPGAESPFAVTILNVGDVGRYRVSFKADDRIVPHVDRRDRTVADAKQP